MIDNKLYYIALAEGFAILSFHARDDGTAGELISLDGYTSDVRKATPIANKAKAYGAAKLLARGGFSRRQYYCVMEATSESFN